MTATKEADVTTFLEPKPLYYTDVRGIEWEAIFHSRTHMTVKATNVPCPRKRLDIEASYQLSADGSRLIDSRTSIFAPPGYKPYPKYNRIKVSGGSYKDEPTWEQRGRAIDMTYEVASAVLESRTGKVARDAAEAKRAQEAARMLRATAATLRELAELHDKEADDAEAGEPYNAYLLRRQPELDHDVKRTR